MKKILAVLLAVSMLFAFAACGGNDEGTTTTAPAIEETEAPAIEETEAPAVDESEASAVDESAAATEAPVADPSAADPSAVDPSAAEESTAAVADKEMTKAEFVAFLNAETAKAAKGKYDYKRVCSYTDPIDVGGATDILNGIISAIDENSNLDTVVGGFLGIGTITEAKDDYALKATTLKESDLTSFSYANGVYTFTLANVKNPKKTGATSLSRFTNDFITHEEVVQGVADFTTAITVNETNVDYKDIKVQVAVSGGKITSITYSYAFAATLALKAVVKINGDGAAKLTATYSNIKY